MDKIKKITAAAAAFALAAAVTGCTAPEAITFGKGSQTALTVDGYEVPAGIFVYNEIYAYNNAAYTLYAENGTYPTQDVVKDSTIDDMDAAEWIQDQATDYCKDFVVTEREFAQIGEELTEEELQLIKESLDANSDNELFTKNGVGETSLRSIIANSYKQLHVFNHYYGLDSEYGCSEDELKEYFTDKTARIKYFSISLTDSEGNELDEDTQHEIENKIKNYLREINAESTDLGKLQKFDECKDDYNEFLDSLEAAEAEDEGSGEDIVTTTTVSEEVTTTTTTTTDPYANEVTITKYTTTTADENDSDTETTTTEAEETDSQKATREFNEYVFNELENYKAERYEYDENTVYIVIKADITERMTDDDLWSEDSIDSLLQERYYEDFTDRMKEISDGYTTERNSSAYRKYTPFKLTLETE